MKRGQVFVRAQDANGKWQSVDALDLDEISFRAFVLEKMARSGQIVALKPEHCPGEDIVLRTRGGE